MSYLQKRKGITLFGIKSENRLFKLLEYFVKIWNSLYFLLVDASRKDISLDFFEK